MNKNFPTNPNGIWGIYKIENKVNGKIYIGKDKDVDFRHWSHKHYLDMGNHHNPELQFDYDLYGAKSFTFKILETLPKEKQKLTELAWLELYYIFEVYKDQNLYNVQSQRDQAVYHVAKQLSDWGSNFDLRNRIDKFILDFILYDDLKMIVLDIHDPNDPKGRDQVTIKNHQTIAKERGMGFNLLNISGFYSNAKLPPEKHLFIVRLPKNFIYGREA